MMHSLFLSTSSTVELTQLWSKQLALTKMLDTAFSKKKVAAPDYWTELYGER